MAALELRVGDTVGRYTLESHLGTGGFATVWVARDAAGIGVAIKLLRDEVALDADARARFAREIGVLGELEHPGIVRLAGHDLTASPPYFVMERVIGQCLRERLIEWAAMRRTFSPAEVAEIVIAMADALSHAHRSGIVHRDLKPANVLLDVHDRPRILDFGLARLVGIDQHAATTLGRVMGTRYYWAPEQALGEEAGPATDQFCLATITFEMLTLRRAWVRGEGDREALEMNLSVPGDVNRPLAILERLMEGARPLASAYAEVPRAVDGVLARAWSVDPAARFADVRAFASALRDVLLGEVEATVAGTWVVGATDPTRLAATRARASDVGADDAVDPTHVAATRASSSDVGRDDAVDPTHVAATRASSSDVAAVTGAEVQVTSMGRGATVGALIAVVIAAMGALGVVLVWRSEAEVEPPGVVGAPSGAAPARAVDAPAAVGAASVGAEALPVVGVAGEATAVGAQVVAPEVTPVPTLEPDPESAEAAAAAEVAEAAARARGTGVARTRAPRGRATEASPSAHAARASPRAAVATPAPPATAAVGLRRRLDALAARPDLEVLAAFADELDALAARIEDAPTQKRVRRLVATGSALGDVERLREAVRELERAGAI